jgi:hypothetical protein
MKRGKGLQASALHLVISISLSFALLLFSFSDVSASHQTAPTVAKPENNLLQFKAGDHVLGFAPDKAYLASMDHALTVQFVGTEGVVPKADANAAGASAKVPPLGKLIYRDLWDGISLTYVATKDGITESTYHIAPGMDVSRIRLRYNVPCTIQKDGSLRFVFDAGNMTESAPIAWQDIDGRRRAVEVGFTMKEGIVGFQVGNYNKTHPLIIDPTYQWHTFYGADSWDIAQGIAMDSNGNIYVTGYSANSWNGPAGQPPLNPFTVGSLGNVFVLKLNSSGAYQWHTFYGAGGGETAQGVGVDGAGNVYVAGESPSAWNGPAPANMGPLHAWSAAPGCSNLFALKLNGSGAYQWHTFYGPPRNGDNCSGNIMVKGIAMDGSGNVYVTGDDAGAGWTGPGGEAAVNLFNTGYTWNSYVLKLNGSGAYQWHTFSGYTNNGGDTTNAIAIDGSGSIYVTGSSSTNWNGPGVCSTPGISPCPLNNFNATTDIFVLKLNSSGVYQWHTFYGSAEWSSMGAYAMALDGNGGVYVTGWSSSAWNGPGTCSTPGASPCPLNDFSGYSDIFVLKLNSSGDYQWHTFYGSGGNANVYGKGIAIDGGGNVYVSGISWQTWNGPNNAPPLNASGSFAILKLNSSGAYQWHTFDGSGSDYVNGMGMDGSGNLVVTGHSQDSWNGPGNTAPLHAHSGPGNQNDLFVLKLNDLTFYSFFSSDGLYSWNGSAWTLLTKDQPATMLTSGSSLYARFAAYGLYQWNGLTWTRLTKDQPSTMLASATTLYADFPGWGLYGWDGAAWTRLTGIHPQDMIASGSMLYCYFAGDGLYSWNGTTWTLLTRVHQQSMVASGSTLYAFFTGDGLYQWNGTSWTLLTRDQPSNMLASGSALYADFPGWGVYSWNGSAWTALTSSHPARMLASGSFLYADFAGDGFYTWNGSTWSLLTRDHPTNVLASGSYLYADFAAYGLYLWNGNTWSKLTGSHPVTMLVDGGN